MNMLYLKKFELLDEQQEHAVVFYQERRRIFNSYYPIGLFTQNNFKEIISISYYTLYCHKRKRFLKNIKKFMVFKQI